jgi:hypothetical protein
VKTRSFVAEIAVQVSNLDAGSAEYDSVYQEAKYGICRLHLPVSSTSVRCFIVALRSSFLPGRRLLPIRSKHSTMLFNFVRLFFWRQFQTDLFLKCTERNAS